MEFDVNAFMSASFDGQLDTKLIPHPAGEFTGQVDTGEKAVVLKPVAGKDGRTSLKLNILLNTDDPAGSLFAQMGRKATVFHEFFLDISEGGTIDFSKGKNIKLGQLREAVGQNKPGQWRFDMLKGQPLRYVIEHDPRPTDPGIVDARVRKVTKVSG